MHYCFFCRLGLAIGKRPVTTVVVVLLACFACGAGMVRFYQIDASSPIWVDPKSSYIQNKEWVDKNFPSKVRVSIHLIEAENILETSALLEVRHQTLFIFI